MNRNEKLLLFFIFINLLVIQVVITSTTSATSVLLHYSDDDYSLNDSSDDKARRRLDDDSRIVIRKRTNFFHYWTLDHYFRWKKRKMRKERGRGPYLRNASPSSSLDHDLVANEANQFSFPLLVKEWSETTLYDERGMLDDDIFADDYENDSKSAETMTDLDDEENDSKSAETMTDLDDEENDSKSDETMTKRDDEENDSKSAEIMTDLDDKDIDSNPPEKLTRNKKKKRMKGRGWSPEAFPNPTSDPKSCKISTLLESHGGDNNSSLLLCDPDSMLSSTYLNRVASALFNFGSGLHFPVSPDQQNCHKSGPVVQVAVAIVKKINIQESIHTDAYTAYEDQEDLINDAAQFFSRYLHDAWDIGHFSNDDCNSTTTATAPSSRSGILIFLSIQDRICFISTGAGISTVLPWWRLERVVSDMKPDLRRRNFGEAILRAIDDLQFLLEEGPPTFSDRFNDFVERFGVVISFALFTFLFAAYGEYRDRFRRWQYTEARSRLTPKEKLKAKSLMKEYKVKDCPICLESFPKNEDGILPTKGSDDLPLKLLRCGHAFDTTCWKCWVNSGYGNPCKCPVCRQDIGGSSRRRNSNSTNTARNNQRLFRRNTQITITDDHHPNNDNNGRRTTISSIWGLGHQYGTFTTEHIPFTLSEESRSPPLSFDEEDRDDDDETIDLLFPPNYDADDDNDGRTSPTALDEQFDFLDEHSSSNIISPRSVTDLL